MNKKKISMLFKVCFAVLLVWCTHCLTSFAYIEDIDPEADAIKAEIEKQDKIAQTYEGSIVDVDGNVVCYSIHKGAEGGVIDHECYQSLVGFSTGLRYGASGIRSDYYDELWERNSKTSKGATITLTTKSEIQSVAYEEIKSYSEGESCAIVLENKTGRVIALASANAQYNLDYNNITEASMNEANKIDGYFLNPCFTALAPGSVMKAATAVAIVEKGLAEDIYYDNGKETVDGHTFHNYGNNSFGNVELVKGMKNSVNTYFAHEGMKVGSYSLRDVYERLMIGKTIELDFGTVTSEHNLDKDISKTNIAASAFGQGKLMLTPINIALIAQSIANDGVMLKPYVIHSIVTDSGNVLKQGKKEVLSEVADKDTIDVVKDALYKTAAHYGIEAKRGIAAKTGTAQLGNGKNRATFMSFNDDYTVVITVNNTSMGGSALKASALRIYDALETI